MYLQHVGVLIIRSVFYDKLRSRQNVVFQVHDELRAPCDSVECNVVHVEASSQFNHIVPHNNKLCNIFICAELRYNGILTFFRKSLN